MEKDRLLSSGGQESSGRKAALSGLYRRLFWSTASRRRAPKLFDTRQCGLAPKEFMLVRSRLIYRPKDVQIFPR
jgi:hypothetical protein